VRAQARCANHPSVESGWSDSFTVTISNVGPDLTGQWIVPVTQTCKNTSRGQKCTIKGTFTANNIGNRDASSAYVHFYLSDDDTYDEGDTQLKQSSTGKIKGGRGKSIKFSYSFPLGQIVTGKYIIAVIDKDNSVAEINETNNIITYGPIL
jgi:subtilase family serine protease